jgi:hypothetical protein
VAAWLATGLALARPARAVDVEVPPERSRVEAVGEALRAEVERALASCPGGAVVVRVESALEGTERAHALVGRLLDPTVRALASMELDGRPRWPVAHRASFASEPGDVARQAGRLGYDVLVDVHIAVIGNFLEVRGATWTTASATRHAELAVRSRLDAELRRSVGRLPRVTADTLVARATELPGRGYLALRAHDLDGDGRTELVAVTGAGVSVHRLGEARVGVRLEEVGRAPYPADVPPASVRRRRPLATTIAVDGAVIVRTTEHGAPVRVALVDGRVTLSRASGPCADGSYPLEGGCASLAPGRDHFEERLEGPSGVEAPPAAPSPFYVHATRRLRGPDGRVLRYEAVVTPLGRLALRVDERSVAAVGYGTALAMADLDDDGAVELLTSAASPAGAGDRLALLRASARGGLRVVWRSEPIEGSVWIADRGDLDSDGLEELLAVEEPPDPQRGAARLWIVR